ncbi:D-alanyl-D-alanine carboxypeptidase family protein [Sporolactobacillus sp. THM7-4]|nr:D-alanyl-D-alanine carboxypeptidase family protein [Sporolactobacillus sp. THM7-4]
MKDLKVRNMKLNPKFCLTLASAALLSLSACSQAAQVPEKQEQSSKIQQDKSNQGKSQANIKLSGEQANNDSKMVSPMSQKGVHVVADPDSTLVLVNKHFKLPDHYVPRQLVYPNVPFITSQRSEKFKMRKVAADALEKMFAAAKKDGISLAGVSAYRSFALQTVLFNNYARQDGVKKALTYCASPGTSEHETGLAIDVSGTSGMYAATEAFAKTAQAKWLAEHAQNYGFIIRYPKGKEKVTGYEYEAWHIRYVGVQAAKTITKNKLALEEYLRVVPVTK